jgi:DNA-binding PadR family transcriptional regulator
VEGESPRKGGRDVKMFRRTAKGKIGLEERFAEQKLVLSDDDIEDD